MNKKQKSHFTKLNGQNCCKLAFFKKKECANLKELCRLQVSSSCLVTDLRTGLLCHYRGVDNGFTEYAKFCYTVCSI